MATLTSALNLYTTDQSGAPTFSLGNASDTYPSIYDPAASSTCGTLGLPSLSTSTGQSWYCSTSSTFRQVNSNGWIPVNFSNISSGSPIGNLPADPVNQTSSGLFYSYNTNGTQFEVTANLESSKYKTQYGNNPQTPYFPEVISAGTQNISALYSNTGLVGYWPMDEGSGSSTVDASGNGNTGKWNGSTTNGTYYAGGKVGSYAGNFDGSSTWIGVGTSTPLNLTTNYTLSGWVSPTAANLSQNEDIIGKSNNSVTGSQYVLRLNGPQVEFVISNGTSYLSPEGGTVSANTWSFVSGTFDGTNMRVYLNAKLVATGTFTGTPSTFSGQTIIGANPGNGADWVSGSIDDVRVYSRVLSPAEIMALYNAEK